MECSWNVVEMELEVELSWSWHLSEVRVEKSGVNAH